SCSSVRYTWERTWSALSQMANMGESEIIEPINSLEIKLLTRQIAILWPGYFLLPVLCLIQFVRLGVVQYFGCLLASFPRSHWARKSLVIPRDLLDRLGALVYL